ncbi:hypothetical protein KR032_009270 [Drosophila birchii]|nr:hypothetical protein KR032_009270 [Drosophila birchii]
MSLKRSYEVRFISWKSTGPSLECQFRILGRDHRVNGTLHIEEDLKDDLFTFGVETYLDVYGNGDYKVLPISISNGKVCQTLKTHWKLFFPTLEYGVNTDFPINNITDPIPKGVYYIKDMVVKPDNWPLIVPRGFIKVLFYFYKDKQMVSKQEVTIQIQDRLL